MLLPPSQNRKIASTSAHKFSRKIFKSFCARNTTKYFKLTALLLVPKVPNSGTKNLVYIILIALLLFNSWNNLSLSPLHSRIHLPSCRNMSDKKIRALCIIYTFRMWKLLTSELVCDPADTGALGRLPNKMHVVIMFTLLLIRTRSTAEPKLWNTIFINNYENQDSFCSQTYGTCL